MVRRTQLVQQMVARQAKHDTARTAEGPSAYVNMMMAIIFDMRRCRCCR
jgi:hypothetical protein